MVGWYCQANAHFNIKSIMIMEFMTVVEIVVLVVVMVASYFHAYGFKPYNIEELAAFCIVFFILFFAQIMFHWN